VFLVPLSSRAVDPDLQTLLLRISLSRLGGKHRHAPSDADSPSTIPNSTGIPRSSQRWVRVHVHQNCQWPSLLSGFLIRFLSMAVHEKALLVGSMDDTTPPQEVALCLLATILMHPKPIYVAREHDQLIL